jgi:hypothetical protein
VVYTRTVKGKVLTFASSGRLYKDALVLFDHQTGSLWTQLDGRGLRGPWAEARLRSVLSAQTIWREWKRVHPDTLVLKKDPRIQSTSYRRYHSDERLGVAGSANPDPRLPGKTLVVGLREQEQAIAVPLASLQHRLFLETKLHRRPLVVVFDPKTSTVRAFYRRLGDRTLSFEVVRRGEEILLRDRQTATLWSASEGKGCKARWPASGCCPFSIR